MQMVVCASPAYAEAYGLPRQVDDLARHHCINFRTASGHAREWEFKIDGVAQRRLLAAQHTFNDLDLILQAVLQDQGIAQLPGYLVCDLLRSRKLVICLAQHAPDDGGHYLCYLSRKQLPARIRAFADHITGRTRALDLQCLATLANARAS